MPRGGGRRGGGKTIPKIRNSGGGSKQRGIPNGPLGRSSIRGSVGANNVTKIQGRVK